MKSIYVSSMILAAVITSAGCCSSMCHGNKNNDGTCPSCSAANATTCPVCGTSMDQGKCPMMGKQKMAEINTAALKDLIGSGVSLTLVDARTGKYDDGRRISNALNLGPDATDEAIQKMLPSKDALIVTYCTNLKCQASWHLAEKLDKLGYKHVLEYPQGIEGWVAEGNPVTQAPKMMM